MEIDHFSTQKFFYGICRQILHMVVEEIFRKADYSPTCEVKLAILKARFTSQMSKPTIFRPKTFSMGFVVEFHT